MKHFKDSLKRHLPKSSRRKRSGEETGTLPAASNERTPLLDQQTTQKRDLWHEALEGLDESTKRKLREAGMSEENTASIESQLEALRKDAETLQDKCKDGEFKVQVGSHEIPVRKTILEILGWVEKAGDVAIKFSPSPGAGVWAVVKFALQKVDGFDKNKTTLLSVVDQVAMALFSAEVYHEIYTIERTKKPGVVAKLHDSLVALYRCILELLATSLGLCQRTGAQILESVLDSGKVADSFEKLHELRQELADVADVCEITAKAHTDETAHRYLQESHTSLRMIAKEVKRATKRADAQEISAVLEWISNINHESHYQSVEDRRDPQSGNWLLKDARMIEWLDSSQSRTILLQGSPGTGKTFLTTAVLKYIKSIKLSEGQSKQGLAFFFCNRDEQSRRSNLSILRSLVRQLAMSKDGTEIREGLLRAQVEAKEKETHFDVNECKRQLVESFNHFSRTTIVLDALDEVIENEIHALLGTLETAIRQSTGIVKLFVSSRREKRIQLKLSAQPTIEMQDGDNKNDMESHVIRTLDDHKEHDPDSAASKMREQIQQAILGKCDNLFLLAALQLEQVLACDTRDAVKELLNNLPTGLTNTYEQIYKKIQARASSEQAIAERALMWVLASPEPLRQRELLFAVRMGISKDTIAVSGPLETSSLLAICNNFLVLDQELRWTFPHLTVREYFETTHIGIQRARSHCAQVCLLYLMKICVPANRIGQSYCEDIDGNHEAIDSSEADLGYFKSLKFKLSSEKDPDEDTASEELLDAKKHLFTHAWEFWPCYAHSHPKEDRCIFFLKQFLGLPYQSSIAFRRWFLKIEQDDQETFGPLKNMNEFHYINLKDLAPATTPIFAIAWFSLYKGLEDWCESAFLDSFQKNDVGMDLLSVSLFSGNIPLSARLLSKRASVNELLTEGIYGTWLICASAAGNLDTVEYLVKAGADVSLLSSTGHYGSSIAAAVKSGNIEVAEYLINSGADVNPILNTGDYGSALAAGTHDGSLEIVELLVNAGADVNQILSTGHYGSALVAAAAKNYRGLDVVKYLVETGADVNLRLSTGNYGNALAAASARLIRRLDAVKYLVEAGADVNMRLSTGKYGSALAAAAAAAASPNGKLNAVKYLVEAGADVNLKLSTGNYGSALAAAATCSMEMLDLVKCLVEAGADANLVLQEGHFGSALAAAVASPTPGNLTGVKYLVEEAGADVNLVLQGGYYGSALAAAATATLVSDHPEDMMTCMTIKYLLDSKADVNMKLQTGALGSVLIAAAVCWRGEGRWADELDPCNLSKDWAQSSNEVAQSRVIYKVNYLLDAGADINEAPKIGIFGSALAAAAMIPMGLDLVKCLVQRGANINLVHKTGKYSSPLAAAEAEAGSESEIYKYLCESQGMAERSPPEQIVNQEGTEIEQEELEQT